MTEITIRRAGLEDLPAIEQLRLEAMSRREHFLGPAAMYAALKSDQQHSNSMVLVAEKNNAIVGYRSVHNLSSPIASFGSLFVSKPERDLGVGRILSISALNEIFSLSHMKRALGKILEEEPEKFLKAKAIYRSMGFTVKPSGEFRISRAAWLKAREKA